MFLLTMTADQEFPRAGGASIKVRITIYFPAGT